MRWPICCAQLFRQRGTGTQRCALIDRGYYADRLDDLDDGVVITEMHVDALDVSS